MNETCPPSSNARRIVLIFLGALVFVLYLDRVCIGKAAPLIEKELRISHTAMGYIFGAFTISYGLFEVPTGRWGDRFGSRGVLTRIVVWWSIFTALTGCVPGFSWDTGIPLPWSSSAGAGTSLLIDSFLTLLIVRFLFGAGEAGALPNNARVVSQWFPLEERGGVQGVILTCQQLGGACAPVLAAYLIDLVGWRWTFVIFGNVGLVWATLFYRWFRDDPADHPGVNAVELARIAAGRGDEANATGHDGLPWRLVLTSPNVWLLGIIMNCAAAAAYMYMFWFPTYLQDGCGVDATTAGWLAGLVLGGGALGSWCGGWLTARVEHWTGEPRNSRRGLGFVCLAIAGGCLAAIPMAESPVTVGVCAALACGLSQMQVANWWSVVMAISGRHLGALFGLMNSMGVVGAFLSPILFGRFADWRGAHGYTGRPQWDPAYFVYAGVLMAGALCWLFVDATRSVVEEPRVESDARTM